MKVLHIYGQKAWHDEAAIVGTCAELIRLRDILSAVIRSGAKGIMETCTADGEGYPLHVIPVSYQTSEKLRLPYTDDLAADTGGEAVGWWTLP